MKHFKLNHGASTSLEAAFGTKETAIIFLAELDGKINGSLESARVQDGATVSSIVEEIIDSMSEAEKEKVLYLHFVDKIMSAVDDCDCASCQARKQSEKTITPKWEC